MDEKPTTDIVVNPYVVSKRVIYAGIFLFKTTIQFIPLILYFIHNLPIQDIPKAVRRGLEQIPEFTQYLLTGRWTPSNEHD